jgi:hypothetical protein
MTLQCPLSTAQSWLDCGGEKNAVAFTADSCRPSVDASMGDATAKEAPSESVRLGGMVGVPFPLSHASTVPSECARPGGGDTAADMVGEGDVLGTDDVTDRRDRPCACCVCVLLFVCVLFCVKDRYHIYIYIYIYIYREREREKGGVGVFYSCCVCARAKQKMCVCVCVYVDCLHLFFRA